MNDLSCFTNQGFVWKRHALAVDEFYPAPTRSLRNMNLSSELISACQMAVSDVMPGAFPTRVTLFAKSSDRSWSLGWHQDRVIAVADKHDVAGYKNWTRKAGVWHVMPPVDVLNNMVFAQIYFDPVGPLDGPMQIHVGSHKFGKIYKDQINSVLASTDRHICQADPGDLLICHSLLVHRSLPSQTHNARRILRIDFANFGLPEPLNWNSF